jgi:hypothetical protein
MLAREGTIRITEIMAKKLKQKKLFTEEFENGTLIIVKENKTTKIGYTNAPTHKDKFFGQKARKQT